MSHDDGPELWTNQELWTSLAVWVTVAAWFSRYESQSRPDSRGM